MKLFRMKTCGWICVLLLTTCPFVAAQVRPNVLFIISDDLRPQLGCYGDTVVKSPNIDSLAESGMRFDHAYVQQAVCSPSRNSFLSGLRPGTTGLRGFGKLLRDTVPDVVTLPQHFKNNGYHAAAMGKVFHIYAETGLGSENDPESWSVPLYEPKNPVWGPVQMADRQKRIDADQQAGVVYKHSHDWPRGETFDDPDIPDDQLRDGETARMAAAFLEERAAIRDEPFFLAVGFFLPHLPFVAPKEYFDLYADAEIPLPEDIGLPMGAPKYAANLGWVESYHNFPAVENRDADFKRAYIQAYYASISYMDACTGIVLDALDKNGLADNTIIVFIGDHGYLMGEHGSWGHKHCNYEMAVRAPLIVRAPGMASGHTGALVEFIDLYATLADLAGLPDPVRQEGTSFAPLLDDPLKPWKGAAFSSMRRGKMLGQSVRTARYRYVEWTNQNGKLDARELYDYEKDPKESRNLVDDPEYAEVAEQHAVILQRGWRAENSG